MKHLTLAAAAALIMTAAPLQAQDPDRLNSALFVAGTVDASDGFGLIPGIGGHVEVDFGLLTVGGSTVFTLATQEHRVTSLDVGFDLGPFTMLGYVGYVAGDQTDAEDPNGEPGEIVPEWAELGLGAAFTTHGLAFEVRLGEDFFGDNRRNQVDVRLVIN